MLPPRLLSIGLIAVLLIALGGYIYYQSAEFVRGPVLIIESPNNGDLILDPLVTIEGKVEHVSQFYLNGRQIFADSEGQFREQLLLAPGYTIMSLEAQDRFNRSTESSLELVYNAKENN